MTPTTPEAHFATLDTSVPDADAHALAMQYAPHILFDNAEPFLPSVVGYTVFNVDGVSPSFPREIELTDGATRVIEYAVWWDWDIQHLYELEHIWVYINDADEVVRVDASWHGGWNRMLEARGRVPLRDGKVTLYSEPGKHAFAATIDPLVQREPITRAGTGDHAGKMGVHVTPLFEGVIHDRTPINNRVVMTYLQQRRFAPTYQFKNRFELAAATFVPWERLFAWIPERVTCWVTHLAVQIPYHERHIMRIAHRGASAHAQEGSASSIQKAAELGADTVEIDIQFTRDSVPVVFHDATLKRVFGVESTVRDLTLSHLKSLTPEGMEPVMTLEEMGALCRSLSLGLYLDIKSLDATGIEAIFNLLDEYGMFKYTIFSSFRADWAAEIKAQRPDAVTSVLFNSTHIEPVALAAATGADYVHPCFERLDVPQAAIAGDWIDAVREAGLGVVCWHEERPDVIEALYALGVDGICSDQPELLTEAAARREPTASSA